MDADARPGPCAAHVDQDRLRFSQAVVAIGALVAYVFRAPVLDPILAAAVLVAMGPEPARDVLAVPYDRWLATRRRREARPRAGAGASPGEPIGRARLVQVTTIVSLGAAGFWWLVGALGLAELFSLIGAAFAALYATTGIIAVASLVDTARRTRRRRAESAPPRDRSSRRPHPDDEPGDPRDGG